MTTDKGEAPQDISADLAFVKALVSEGGRAQMSGGAAFFASGLCYGAQCLVQGGEMLGWYRLSAQANLVAGIAPTVVFIVALAWILGRNRNTGPRGVATRALDAAFGSAGLANLFMVFAFGYNAITQRNIAIWFYYPLVVCAFQGAVWYSAYMIRRKLWLALVSAGWFLTVVVAAVLIRSAWYVLVLGAALLILMGGSGWHMMRQAKRAD